MEPGNAAWLTGRWIDGFAEKDLQCHLYDWSAGSGAATSCHQLGPGHEVAFALLCLEVRMFQYLNTMWFIWEDRPLSAPPISLECLPTCHLDSWETECDTWKEYERDDFIFHELAEEWRGLLFYRGGRGNWYRSYVMNIQAELSMVFHYSSVRPNSWFIVYNIKNICAKCHKLGNSIQSTVHCSCRLMHFILIWACYRNIILQF